MALTGSFGPVPEEWRQRPMSTQLEHEGAYVLTLMVRVRAGMTSRTIPLAAGTSQATLAGALGRWLGQTRNREIYVDHEFLKTPLIME